jgi:chromosome segregation ATPase
MVSPGDILKAIDSIKNQINTLSNEVGRVRERSEILGIALEKVTARVEDSRETAPTIEASIKWLNIQVDSLAKELKEIEFLVERLLTWKEKRDGQLKIGVWLANGIGASSILLHFLDK